MKNLYVASFGIVKHDGKEYYGGNDDCYLVVCTGKAGVPSSVRVGRLLRYGHYDAAHPDTMSASPGDMIVAGLIDRDYGNDMTKARRYMVESFMRPFYTPGVTMAQLKLLFHTALAIYLDNDDIIGTSEVFFPAGANFSWNVSFPSTDFVAFMNYRAKFGLA